ncbi:ATP-binding protein [Streptomyces sp. CC224B]|uniref:ATP-binding protein n=1 Tax=Streptomyces sp. CC224B TaxID=3044571 RepID=UPI0024A88233|nr:ATP-binding protein [Streptomyces sp. CC224B]
MTNPSFPPPALQSPPTHDWSTSYPMTPGSARLARVQVRRQLAVWRWGGDIDDAVLVVSELVANAARHGKAAGHHVWLRLALAEGGGLVVDVSDPVRGFPGFGRTGGGAALEEGGRGLLVVRQLTYELNWFPREAQGKTVRARLPGPVRG